MANLQSMPSKAWSCSSLQRGLERVHSNYGHLCNEDLSEEEMRKEMAVPGLMSPYVHNSVLLHFVEENFKSNDG